MPTPPTHQVNVSRKGVLCAPDSSKVFETLCRNNSPERSKFQACFQSDKKLSGHPSH